MPQEDMIRRLILAGLPGSEVEVRDMTGTRDHFEIEVVSDSFGGQSLIERHRVLHRLLEEPMRGEIHAVKFKTWTPEEKAARR